MISKLAVLLTTVALGASLLTPTPARADDPPDLGRPKPHGNEPQTTIRTTVESRPDGVYVQIEVRQTAPGVQRAATSPDSVRPSIGARPVVAGSSNSSQAPSMSSGSPGGSANTAPQGRTWTDPTGIHHESADGRQIYLTPPLISSATRDSWIAQLQQHPCVGKYHSDLRWRR